MYKEVNSCYTCKYCNTIGSDEVLICCNKESEMCNKEISKFGTCEFYKKTLYTIKDEKMYGGNNEARR